jgi:hypothetical protein
MADAVLKVVNSQTSLVVLGGLGAAALVVPGASN